MDRLDPSATRLLGQQPSDEEILQFVVANGGKLIFSDNEPTETSGRARNPKRCIRETSKALRKSAMSVQTQQALAGQREANRR